MRSLQRNKQKMKYARSNRKIDKKRAQRANDGSIEWVSTGEKLLVYDEPIEFRANINNKIDSKVSLEAYGIDDSSLLLQIVASKGRLPLQKGDAIWKKSEVKTKEVSGNTVTDEQSADYYVIDVADEGLNVDIFLLKRNL